MADSSSKPPLHGHVALVTGATGGIGMATCRLLASFGCSVALHYNSDQDAALALQDELIDKFGRVLGSKIAAYKADMSEYEEVRALHDNVVSVLGPPTILINNAGSQGGHTGVKSVEQVPIEDFERTWRINCGSAYLLTQRCIPAMEDKQWGRVIFVSSLAALTGGMIGPHYASAKSALHGMVHWLAATYAKKGITVNGIAPALIAKKKMAPLGDKELLQRIPLGRLGTPEEIAETVLWMIKVGHLTNKIITLDGGIFPH